MVRRPTKVTIARAGDYTPEQIRAGVRSGKFKPVALDDTINVAEGGSYIAVPRSIMEDGVDFDGLTLPLPPGGVEHRILDYVASTPKTFPQGRAFLHRAHHFALGVEASQQLLLLAREPDWIDAYADYAPHPFSEYTVSLWTGSPAGMVEVLVSVMQNPFGEHIACMTTLAWDTGQMNAYRGTAVPREMGRRQGSAPEDRLAWTFCDAFRLLLSQPRLVVINQGPGNRHAIRKGKRVTFYSKSEVKIDLDAAEKVRTAFRTGHGKMMPVYQYRAHLCHSGGRKGCEHTWTLDPERETPFWTCDRCGRKRWQRRAGQRGSAEIGFVRQTYKVVKGGDK